MARATTITTELGTEKQCICCQEFYPLDSEFWWHNGNRRKDGSKGWCAACKGCYNLYYKRGKYKVIGANNG